MRWGDGAACRAVHAVIRRERAKCAGLPSEEREKGPNRAVGEKANQRLSDAQAAGARPAPDVANFTEVTRPSTVEARTYRLHLLDQSAGHLQPASAQTQRPHRSAIGTAPLPTHTTGQTRRLVHQHLPTAQGPALPRLTHAYLRNWFDEARWPSPGANRPRTRQFHQRGTTTA
jgi:hypothetical protein